MSLSNRIESVECVQKSIGRVILIGLSLLILIVPTIQADPLEPGQLARLNEFIPKTASKLETKQPVHVVFLGDSRLLGGTGEEKLGLGAVFLDELAKTFYYSGGVFDVYDQAHLEVEEAKLTYEVVPIDSPTCLDLMRYLTTRALINEPDFIVMCASPADLTAGMGLESLATAWEQMKAHLARSGAELAVIGPSPLGVMDRGGYLHMVPTRTIAGFLRTWTARKRIPFLDSSRAFFPSSFPFTDGDEAVSVWKGLMTSVRERLAPGGVALSERQHRQLGKDLLNSLLGQLPTEQRYLTSAILTRSGGEGMLLDVRIKNQREETNEAWIFPMVPVSDASEWVGLAQKMEIPAKGTVDFSVPIAAGDSVNPHLLGLFGGEMPSSLLIVDGRYVQVSDFSASLQPVGFLWRDRVLRNQRRTSEVICQILPNRTNLTSLPFRFHWKGEDAKGSLSLGGPDASVARWVLNLPADADERRISGELDLYLGEGAGQIRLRRHIEAHRHFGLGERIPLNVSASESPHGEKETLIEPMLSLIAEAGDETLSLHYDFRNLPLDADAGESAIRLDLAIDGRHERESMSYVGRLQIEAGPKDGPAKVGAFDLAHFGNDYDRIPQAGGINALLSTRPNGDRRLTIGLSRTYFYKHSWSIGNGNAQLGIGTNVEVRLKDREQPVRYELIKNPFHPNDADGLATLEMTERPTPRWTVRLWDERE